MSPTCFSIKINHVIFTNASSDFIVSKQLGFPYPAWFRPNPQTEDKTDLQLVRGTEQLAKTLFNASLYPPNTVICQPIFSVGKRLLPGYYDTAYIRANSYDYEAGTGKIFVAHDNTIYPMEADEELCLGSASKFPLFYKFNLPTMQLQHEILRLFPYNLELLTEPEQQQHHEVLRFIIENGEEQMRQFDY